MHVSTLIELTCKSQILCSFLLKGDLRLESCKIQGKAANPLGENEKGGDKLERYGEGDRREQGKKINQSVKRHHHNLQHLKSP